MEEEIYSEIIKNTNNENIILSLEFEKLFFDRIMTNYWINIKNLNVNYICFQNNMGFIFYIVPEKNDKFKFVLKKEEHSTFHSFSEKIIDKQHAQREIINLVDSLILYSLIYYNLFI